ncbi:MAG: hypothetical protein ACM3PY_21925 [Omnitrophica WOR_2 bacterium]
MANSDDRSASRDAYLAQLAKNLESLGEDSFRKLCEDMGGKYDSLTGEGIANKALNWVHMLEKSRLIPSLVKRGKEEFPGRTWDDLAQVKQYPRSKYSVATTLKELQVVEQFEILGDRFEYTPYPVEADYLIFDLDHPPADWIKFLGSQEHVSKLKPYYGTTIFVRLQPAGGQEPGEVQLDGSSIIKILGKLHPEGYNFNLCSTKEDLVRALVTLDENRQNQLNLEKLVSLLSMTQVKGGEKSQPNQVNP